MPALTAHSVEKIKPADARAEIVDALVPGLRLVVQPTGVKSWALRYSFGRRHHKMTIGRYPKISLSDARDAARDALQRLARGVDPSTGPRSGVAVDASFAAAVADYKTLHVAKLRPATIYYVTRELDAAVEAWRGQPLKSIRRADVIALVDDAAKRGPNAGNCCLQVMAAFFSWCESRDLIEASPTNGVRRVALAKTFSLPDPITDPKKYQLLFRRLEWEAKQAKIMLSARQEVIVGLFDIGDDLEGGPLELELTLKRADLEPDSPRRSAPTRQRTKSTIPPA
jgi:hypothetical protein